jgi:DNA-binding beta-propeller fold protein YncE
MAAATGRFGAALVRIPAWHRDLGLNPAQAPEFTSTPGQVAFTPDGTKLIVTTKGNGNDVNVFAVGPGGLSAKPVVNADPGNVPFAVSFDAGGHLAVAEAGANAVATFTVRPDGTLGLIDPAGKVVVSVYSSGAIGRLVPDDVAGLVRYAREHTATSA